MGKAVLILSLISIATLSSCINDDFVTFDSQLANDILIIDNFLLENGIDAIEHESGIRYVVQEEGDGEIATTSNMVHTKFVGKFLDGNTFVSNLGGVSFRLDNQLIQAWLITIPLINEGGKMTIYAPSVYCFGTNGQGSIPANANLIYEIELVDADVNVEDQLGFDTELIDNYLVENEIEALQHESGIRYVVTEEGTGESPEANDVVNVKYEGRFLTGDVFDSNTSGVSFALANLIQAWKTMIPLMKEGGKMTIYAQSGYCYGIAGNGSIPANESLIFDIELVVVE